MIKKNVKQTVNQLLKDNRAFDFHFYKIQFLQILYRRYH